MKKLYRLFIVLTLVFLGFSQNANASHISGVDFSYTCVGQDSFLITFNIFRDCDGINAPTSANVSFTSSCGGSFNQTLILQNPGGTEVSQLCATSIVNSTCSGGILPGMQQYIYTGIVVLSPSCNYWTMSWNSCCRNPAVVNLVNPNTLGMWIEGTIYSGNDSCNNSPVFNSAPIPYVCFNQVVNYNFGVTEPDGDSIVYAFVTPLSAATTPVPFATGYTFTSPIPGIVLNTATGQLTFTPTTLGNFVMAIQVCEYEYGTGLLLGCVTRDIQFVVINCSNNQPEPPPGGISNFQGNGVQIGPDSVEVCVGNNFSFDLVYTDIDPADSITLFSNISAVLPGATVTTVNGNPATITVAWTAQGGSAPFNSFTVTATDGACPTPGIVVSSYNVIVVPSTYAGVDVTICQGTQWTQLGAVGGSQFVWTAIPIPGGPPVPAMDTIPTSPGFNATCIHCQFPTVSPSVTTAYQVISNLSGTCVNIDTVIVNVAPNFDLVMPNDTLICSIDDYPLVLTTSEPGFTYTYNWSPSSSLDFDTVASPVANPSDPTVYHVTMTASGGCVKKGDVFIDLSPPFPGNMEIIGDTVLCLGSSTQLDIDFGTMDVGSCGLTTQGCLGVVQNGDLGTAATANGANSYPAVYGGAHWGAKHQILYRASELANMGMGSGGLIYSASFFVNVVSSMPQYTDFTIKIGCSSDGDFTGGWVNSGNLQEVYYSPGYIASTGWNTHTFSTPYKWDGASSVVIEVCFNSIGSTMNAVMPFTATGYQSVIYQVGNNSNVCGTVGAGSLSNNRPNTRFNYCSGVDPSALSFVWSPTAGLSNGIIHNPIAGPITSTTYQLIVTDTFGGCADTLTHFIDVVTEFDASFVFNDPYCVSASPVMATVNVGGGYFTGPAVDSSGLFYPDSAGVGLHSITYTIPFPLDCANDTTIIVIVIPLPDASINYREVCFNGDTVILSVTTPGGIFSGPGIIDGVNGVFDPGIMSPGVYNIAYTLTQPCFNSDTTGIKIIEPYSFTFNNAIVQVCQDATVDLSGNYTLVTGPNQGIGPVIALWTDANGYISSTGVFDATGVPNGNYFVTLNVTGMDGTCGTSTQMSVVVLKIDYPEFPSGLVFCDNEKKAIVSVVPYAIGAGAGYSQTPISPLGANDTIDFVPAGTNLKFDATNAPIGSWEFEVFYTNINGCTGVTIDTIYVLETPDKPSPDEAAYCQGEDIYLTGTGKTPDSLYWYHDINLLNLVGVGSPTYYGVAPDPADGDVFVWVTQNNWQCISPAVKYLLPVKEAPNADFTMNYVDTTGKDLYGIPHTQSPIYGFNPFGVTFTATNAIDNVDSIWWNHHAESGSDPSWVNDNKHKQVGFTYSKSNYSDGNITGKVFITQLIVTNEFGCADTSQAMIFSVGTEDYYNVFTPNGDGVNDVFFISNTSLDQFKVEIFNRWGTKVYGWENDPLHGWDGGDSPEGVYFWTLIGTYANGIEFKKQGTVTLTGRN